MSQIRIRIGFIGLNPDKQWAMTAHIPALSALSEDFEIRGVANTSYESAQRAAEAFKIPVAFENAESLIRSEEIDLVVITVRVPFHYELVRSALNAGKHVYCEHPLGNGLKETRALAGLAAQKNVVAVVGTQMIVSPEILYLKKLIEEGYIGNVLSTTLVGSADHWRDKGTEHMYYINDRSFGANMLTVPVAHNMAGLIKVLGNIGELTARMYNNFHEVILTDTGETRPKTAEDQIMVIGALESGAAFSIHYRGGTSRGTNLLWEINGSEGDIQVTGPTGHGQLLKLALKGARGDEQELQPLKVPDEYYEGLPADPVIRNVAAIYRLIAGDIRNGTRKAPTFDLAVSLHTVLDNIERSAAESSN